MLLGHRVLIPSSANDPEGACLCAIITLDSEIFLTGAEGPEVGLGGKKIIKHD